MFDLMNISGSGMTANKAWLETIGNNVTNIQTTRTEEGGPYKRQIVSFSEKRDFENILKSEIGKGVQVDEILQDDSTMDVFDPTHPDSNEEGYVSFPEINITAEMTDMLMAQRGFEASSTVFGNTKDIMRKTIELGK